MTQHDTMEPLGLRATMQVTVMQACLHVVPIIRDRVTVAFLECN